MAAGVMERSEIEAFIAKVPLFACLTPRARKAICGGMLQRCFKPGEMIVQEEDTENQTFFIIVSGVVNVATFTTEGKQTILATLRKGEFFGEMAILDGEPRSASVVAARSCELLLLYRNVFQEILRTYPEMAARMLVQLSRRLRRANRRIGTLSLMSTCGKVADVIVQIAREQGEKQGDLVVVSHRPAHHEIADMAGTSRETVSRILSQFQKSGYITIDGKKMVILDETKLYH